MAYIDYNRHIHINNGCTSGEVDTCLIAVMAIHKIGILQDVQHIRSFQAYFRCLTPASK